MPILASLGAGAIGAYRMFRGGVAPVIPYIEDVFSTYVYTGDSTNRSIVNNIDLSGKGGLVWIKDRNLGLNHTLFDTARGATKYLSSDSTNAEGSASNTLTDFNSNGFNLGTNSGYVNGSGYTYASWTFRKQAKFFDVVTWTGDGANYRAISHSLGSTPGMVIVKSTSASGAWAVWHRSADPNNLILNSTSAAISGQYSIQDVGSTSFAVANSSFYGFPQSIPVNTNGATYVAYLFAHNAGGFGAAGSDNVISCGGFTVSGGATTTVNLGYEPQWLLIKRVDTTGNWQIFDSMRGFTVSFNNSAILMPNLPDAEIAPGGTARVLVTSTGFQYNPAAAADQMIYIAIRRGPMKTPTSGTSVFGLTLKTSYGANEIVSTSFAPDMSINKATTLVIDNYLPSRLTGGYMITNTTAAEVAGLWKWDGPAGQSYATVSYTGTPIYWSFRRAPGFFDVVCYTGTGSATTFNHNLTVVPELMIIKKRNSATNGGWLVGYYVSASTVTDGVGLNTTDALNTRAWSSSNFNSAPTSTVFGVAGFGVINAASDTYVAYLFATVGGVSKVGSYTGTGTTQQINCGFTNGSRFVMIKRTDSTGDWYVWDSARGIVAGNDPYLLLNSTAAEVTNTDYVDTYSLGFELSSTAPAALNASGGKYIFLAIA